MNSQAKAFITEAEKWVGYLEKESNSNLEDFKANAGDKNFTLFGKWYGLNGFAWCAMFVSYVAWKAGIPESIIPKQKSCTYDGVAFFKKVGRWHPRAGYTPVPGDIIYFTNDGGKTAAHVGIVTAVDSQRVYTIEGNTSGGSTLVPNGGGVAKKSYPLGYDKIYGYGNPAYKTDNIDLIEGYKETIQRHCKFSSPEGVFALTDQSPWAVDLYRKWADSYK